MKIPNRDRAIIEQTKITEYLLNTQHKRGGSKAKMLLRFGYSLENWRQLESDLRQFHVNSDVDIVKETAYGVRYEVRAALITPTSEQLFVRTVWQIDKGTDLPRLITLIPDK